jgi:hypothetical protein
MLTRFVLGNIATGGFLALSMPLAFASLLSLRYAGTRRSAPGRPAQERRDAAAAPERPRELPGRPPLQSSVIGPDRLQSLRAARERRRASSSEPDANRAA